MESKSSYAYKYEKYRNKYLELKKYLGQIGGGDEQYMTSLINPDEPYYFNQNIYSYWINSSHNTYLPKGQVLDPGSLCYYKLQGYVFFSGCMELDFYGVTEDGNDIKVDHLPTNIRGVRLSIILQVIKDILDYLNKNKSIIKTGPIILSIDNKNLDKRQHSELLWKVIKANIPEDYLLTIGPDYNLDKITLSDLHGKVLMRGGQSKKCGKESSPDSEIGHEFCPPTNMKFIDSAKKDANGLPSSWFHLRKSKIDLDDKVTLEKNYSVSTSAPLMDKYLPVNISAVINTQRNLGRIYPHMTNVTSNNYKNSGYFKNGFQLVAINLQDRAEAFYINNAIFLPPVGSPCSPNEVINNSCKVGWKPTGVPMGYRLKPLWLLGLVQYPQLYNLELSCTSKVEVSYEKSSVSLNSTGTISNINVSTPLFVVKSNEKSKGINGVHIPWTLNKLEGTIEVELYEYEENNIKLFSDTPNKDCMDDNLYNHKSSIKVTLKYKWTPSTSKENTEHMNSIKKYNETISKLRTRPVIDYLNNLQLFTDYQLALANAML
jgi:hypothetical protein